MDSQLNRDLLSDLPLGIIHAILERVPITDAVRTCILSRQWRYKWASLPHLSFYEKPLTSLSDFIYQVFLLHQGPILKFLLIFDSETLSQNLNPWLAFLSRKGVRVLNLHCNNEHRVKLASLYSCQNLTRLELFNCDFLPPPPTFKGFLSLRSLDLEFVCVSSNTIQSLLPGLNLLEELRLLNVKTCGKALDLSIRVPNLKILHLKGDFQDISLYAPLLSHMYVEFTKHVAPRKNSVCTYTELLGSLTNLEELKGGPYFFEFLSIGIESCHTPLVFPLLRFIGLPPEVFCDKKFEPVIAYLCKGVPNLHKIKVSYMYSSHPGFTSLRLDSECPFNFMFERVKVIEVGYPYCANNAGGINRRMKLIKCLLARSPALETMICVQPYDNRAFTLLTYPRASPNAKIVFKNM